MRNRVVPVGQLDSVAAFNASICVLSKHCKFRVVALMIAVELKIDLVTINKTNNPARSLKSQACASLRHP